MQIVEQIDIEDALRIDLAELMPEAHVCAQPAPDDLEPGTICITCTGGQEQTTVSDEYDVMVDCWSTEWATAYDLARRARYYVSSLPLRNFRSKRHYQTAMCQVAQITPDPARPQLPHAAFMATVSIRGKKIDY